MHRTNEKQVRNAGNMLSKMRCKWHKVGNCKERCIVWRGLCMMIAGCLMLSRSMKRVFRTELHCCCCLCSERLWQFVHSDTEEGYHETQSAEWINKEVIEMVMFSSHVYFLGMTNFGYQGCHDVWCIWEGSWTDSSWQEAL